MSTRVVSQVYTCPSTRCGTISPSAQFRDYSWIPPLRSGNVHITGTVPGIFLQEHLSVLGLMSSGVLVVRQLGAVPHGTPHSHQIHITPLLLISSTYSTHTQERLSRLYPHLDPRGYHSPIRTGSLISSKKSKQFRKR